MPNIKKGITLLAGSALAISCMKNYTIHNNMEREADLELKQPDKQMYFANMRKQK